MTDRGPEDTDGRGARRTRPPVPKDPPDQQIHQGEDPLDVPGPHRAERRADESGREESDADYPVPDEPSG